MLNADEFEKMAREARVATELHIHCLIDLYREAYLAWKADGPDKARVARIMIVCKGCLGDIERAAQGRRI